MKSTHLITLSVALATTAFASEAPPELAAQRARYDAAAAAALRPVREKYLAELQQLKARAMTFKNLELAIAIEQEIKSFDGRVMAGSGAAAKPLNEFVRGTTWLPQEKNAKWKLVEFTEDGHVDRTPLQGATKSAQCGAGEDANTLQFPWGDGSIGHLRFSKTRTELQFDGATYKLAKP